MKEKLDRIFSIYIRLRDTDDLGWGKCITCGQPFHFKKLECGHFRGRRHLNTRWYEQNAHAQCVECNREDDTVKYMQAMLKKYDIDIPMEIIQLSKHDHKFIKEDYERMYSYFNELVKVLMKSKMFKV